MNVNNQTSVNEFILLGLTDLKEVEVTLFGIFAIFYIVTVLGNLSIMVVTSMVKSLHTPMYFFLWNLSFIDLCFSSVAVPKMLVDFLSLKKVISFSGCICQIHFFHFLGSTEVMLLTIMSLDRYVAIGYPLRYLEIMNANACLNMAITCWVAGFFHALIHTVMTAKLPFCGPNTVNHFFCDVKPVLKLACTDTSLNLKLLIRVTGSLATTSFILTFLSYLCISKFLLRIKTLQGRKNALSTCSAHLTVVFLLFGTAVFTYLRTSAENELDQDRVIAILFTVVTPALNPIIYTLRNKDMRKALMKMISRWALYG
ncbi:olfactory receptor 12D1-like [Lithobates pipiens]